MKLLTKVASQYMKANILRVFYTFLLLTISVFFKFFLSCSIYFVGLQMGEKGLTTKPSLTDFDFEG